MRVRILPYRTGSRSVRALRDEINCRILKLEGSRFRPRWDDLIINWGNCSQQADALTHGTNVLNTPSMCRLASNKLDAMYCFSHNDVSAPPFTDNKEEARQWAQENIVVARTKLRASAGDGIIVVNPGDPVPDAPLYTQYIKKSDEYRIHVFNEEIIDRQRKMRTYEVPDEQVNWQVRNMAGGFVFGRENINVPNSVDREAIKAIAATGLDFGAVDVVYNERREKAYVLEINTAPGLVNTTLGIYSNKIREYINDVLQIV